MNERRVVFMQQFRYKIQDPVGIHARPAGLLAKQAVQYQSDVTISVDGKCGDVKRIFSLMGVAAKHGDTVTIEVKGTDEEQAAKELETFFKDNL